MRLAKRAIFSGNLEMTFWSVKIRKRMNPNKVRVPLSTKIFRIQLWGWRLFESGMS